MPATSGQYGCAKIGASTIAEVDKWSLSKEAVIHEYATCETPGTQYFAYLAGRKRHSGTMEGIYDPDDPIEDYFNEGDTIVLLLYYTTSLYYTGTVIIEKLEIPDVDITEGTPVRWTASFKVVGPMTKGPP